MAIADEAIKDLTSVMTVVGGKIVYAADEFKKHDAPLPPVSPDWSPVKRFGGYQCINPHHGIAACTMHQHQAGLRHAHDGTLSRWLGLDNRERPSFDNPWALGCGCFAY